MHLDVFGSIALDTSNLAQKLLLQLGPMTLKQPPPCAVRYQQPA